MDLGRSCTSCSPGVSRSEEKLQKMYPLYLPVVTIPNGAQRNGCFPSVGEAKALLLLDSSLVDLLEQPDVFP